MSRNNDLISREAVIREILRFKGYLDEDMIFRINFAINRLTAVPQPMSAVEFIKQFSRMCSSYPAYGNDTGCKCCPLEYDSTCDLLMSERAEHFVEVTEKWAQEHPERNEE